MNEAWEDMRQVSNDKNQEYVINLLSHSYVKIESIWKAFCQKKGTEYDSNTFYLFQQILVKLMLCDGDFLQSEYDCYCKFCHTAGVKPLSVADCKSFNNRTSVEKLGISIKMLNEMRGSIGEREFQAMVRSFCHFAFLSDKAIDENEFYIIRCFYQNAYGDYCPETWSRFKQEWI